MPEAPAPKATTPAAAAPHTATMLIFLPNRAPRLVTFSLPKESCTLQEVFEQVNVPFDEDTHIQIMQTTGSDSSEIDYFVSVGSSLRIEDMLQDHPLVGGRTSNKRSSRKKMSRSAKNRAAKNN